MDVFEKQDAKPMLIAEMQEAFDDPEYIFEIKMDGSRCIAYLDKDKTILKNKRGFLLSSKFPELADMHKQVKYRCILDGELIVMQDGKPDFFEVQRRELMSNTFKIDMAVKKHPASFVAYDILYIDDRDVTDLPLIERKKLLSENVKENERLAISRVVEGRGKDLFALTTSQQLEGVVAKRKESRYYYGKRTKDWIKIKWLKDDDFIVCGYIEKEDNFISLVLGQYKDKQLIYKGHVTMGVSRKTVQSMRDYISGSCPFKEIPKGNDNAVWLQPEFVCTVQWMPRKNEGLNQPVFKGFRTDKAPEECIQR